MTATETLRHEIDKIDIAIQSCQDESGVVKPYMKHRLVELVGQRFAFRQSIEWMESQEIGITV